MYIYENVNCLISIIMNLRKIFAKKRIQDSYRMRRYIVDGKGGEAAGKLELD